MMDRKQPADKLKDNKPEADAAVKIATPEPAPVSAPVSPKSEPSIYDEVYARSKDSNKMPIGKYIAVLIVVSIVGLSAGLLGSYIYNANTSNEVPLVSTERDGNTVTTQSEEAIANVADKVSPSVVSILSTTRDMSSYYTAREAQSAGTGIVISKDGYVLTNNHVINSATKVTVVTDKGVTYSDVDVLGRDPLNDIAFLKINRAKDLVPAQLGDSKTIRIGQQVVAIGNALGQYQNTVTSGIISGIGRSVVASSDGTRAGAEELTDLIQTDTAINSGNSGGPLVNLSGQVVGVNTAVAQDANGIGFVIPISSTRGMIDNLLETGKVQRPYVGIRYINITPDVKQQRNLSVSSGALVASSGSGSAVVSGSPADKASVRDGDIITAINGIEVGRKGSVSTLVGEHKVGSEVELTVLRGSRTLKLKLTLAEFTN
jgi:serine protease Do